MECLPMRVSPNKRFVFKYCGFKINKTPSYPTFCIYNQCIFTVIHRAVFKIYEDNIVKPVFRINKGSCVKSCAVDFDNKENLPPYSIENCEKTATQDLLNKMNKAIDGPSKKTTRSPLSVIVQNNPPCVEEKMIKSRREKVKLKSLALQSTTRSLRC